MSRRRAWLQFSDRKWAGRYNDPRSNDGHGAGRPGIRYRFTWRGMQNMDPAKLAKSGTEHAHQRAYFQWLLTWSREVHEHTFAIPNGGARADDRKTAMIRGGQLKAEGVKSGVPDIAIAWPISGSPVEYAPGQWTYARRGYPGAWIEMKKAKGGVVADQQSEWRKRLEARDYFVATCYNWQEAANATAHYFGQPLPFPHASRGE